jgi:radical SAM-linked protein
MDSVGLQNPEKAPVEPFSSYVIRVRFEKTDDFAFFSHHDFIRFLTRLCRRSDLPVRMAGEFRPISQVSCPSPLPLGLEGLSEVVEIDLTEAIPTEKILEKLRMHCPKGLRFTEAKTLGAGTKGRAFRILYQASLNPSQVENVSRTVSALQQKNTWLVQRKGKTGRLDPISALGELAEDGSGENNLEEWLGNGSGPHSPRSGTARSGNRSPAEFPGKNHRPRMVDLKSIVDKIEVDSAGELRLEVNTSDTGTARPEEIFELLGLGEWPGEIPFKRVRVDLTDENTEKTARNVRARTGETGT